MILRFSHRLSFGCLFLQSQLKQMSIPTRPPDCQLWAQLLSNDKILLCAAYKTKKIQKKDAKYKSLKILKNKKSRKKDLLNQSLFNLTIHCTIRVNENSWGVQIFLRAPPEWMSIIILKKSVEKSLFRHVILSYIKYFVTPWNAQQKNLENIKSIHRWISSMNI